MRPKIWKSFPGKPLIRILAHTCLWNTENTFFEELQRLFGSSSNMTEKTQASIFSEQNGTGISNDRLTLHMANSYVRTYSKKTALHGDSLVVVSGAQMGTAQEKYDFSYLQITSINMQMFRKHTCNFSRIKALNLKFNRIKEILHGTQC